MSVTAAQTDLDAQRRGFPLVETLLALLVLAGLIATAALSFNIGYLPQPFFWDVDDTYRDWYSTALWAHQKGAYDTWLSIYPPLSFVLIKIAGIPSCYIDATDKIARACDWVPIVVLHSLYVLNGVIVSRIFIKLDRSTAWQRSFAITAGLPMIFGLERGNLILLCFTLIMLGFGPLVRSARLRWLCIAMAINLKVYLVATIFAQLLRRRWLCFEALLLLTVAVYLVSFILFGEGTPAEIYANLVNFATGAKPGATVDFIYTNTFIPLRYILAESNAPVNYFVGSDLVSRTLLATAVTQHAAQLAIVVACVFAYLRPEVVPPYRLTFFAVAMAMITSETSPYTQPIMFFFVFMERWRGWLRPAAIAACYILCVPWDIYIGGAAGSYQYSYLGQRFVYAEIGLTLGMFLRPLLFMLPAYFLSAATIIDVWRDIRGEGWADRWRFRTDWPMLPGLRKPIMPVAVSRSTHVDASA
jgi:hypothetical protein